MILMDKKILAIAVVLIVAVGGVVACFAILGNGSKSGGDDSVRGVMDVYGNADMNGAIDSDDKKYIQDVLDGKADQTKYCDANHDGKVNADDLTYIQDLIDYKSGTTAYYIDGNKDVAQATFPLKTIVSFGVNSGSLYMLALGFKYPDVIMYDTHPLAPENPDVVLKPFEGAKAIRSATPDDYTTITSAGIPDAVVCPNYYSSYATADQLEVYKKAGIDLIFVNSMDSGGVGDFELTLGFLFNRNAAAQKFANWAYELEDAIKDGIKKVDASKYPDVIAVTGGGQVKGTSSPYTASMKMAGANNAVDFTDDRILYTDPTWLLNYSSAGEYIIHMVVVGYGTTPDGISATYNNYVSKYYTQMDAYKNGKVYVLDNGIPVILRMAYIAELLHPDAFEKGFADSWHQKLIELYGIDYQASSHQFLYTEAPKS